MSDVGLGLSYWLGETRFTVTLTKRNVIETGHPGNTGHPGHFVRPVLDVLISPSAVVDPSSRQDVTIDAGLLERLALTISIDDRGLIESINTEANRGVSPVINHIGPVANLPATASVTAPVPQAPNVRVRPLEIEWVRAHGHLAAHAGELEANIGRLLNAVGHADASPASILQSGQALELLQNQLGAISHVKRGWVAAHAQEVERDVWQLTTSDLLHVVETELPERLADTGAPARLAEMADRFGVLIVIADPDRPENYSSAAQDLQDTLVLRRSRSVQVGAYLRDADGGWRLSAGSVLAMDIVDVFSVTDFVDLNESWLRTKSFHLAYHPDMSLRTFGLTTASNRGAVTAPNGKGSPSHRAATLRPLVQPRTAADQHLESARTRFELLRTTSDYEVLAATGVQAREMTIHEQRRHQDADDVSR